MWEKHRTVMSEQRRNVIDGENVMEPVVVMQPVRDSISCNYATFFLLLRIDNTVAESILCTNYWVNKHGKMVRIEAKYWQGKKFKRTR